MTKEQLEKEAKAECFMLTVNTIGIDQKDVELAYILGRKKSIKQIETLEKENTELRKVAEFQQSSNMSTHFENKKLKEGLAVGSTWNKALNSRNKYLVEERDKYRSMVFDKDEQLTKAKEIIKDYMIIAKGDHCTVCGVPEENRSIDVLKLNEKAEQFLKE